MRQGPAEPSWNDIEIEETRRCAVCGSSRLSWQVRYHGPEHHLTFAKLGSKGVLGGKRDLMVGSSRTRVCLECGHVLLFLDRIAAIGVVAVSAAVFWYDARGTRLSSLRCPRCGR